jgi:lantibiotic modifying enzyme
VRKFDWYNDRIAEQEIEKIVKMADETKEILIAEQYYKELNFSPFQSHLDLLKMIQQKLMSFTRKNALKKRKNALKKRKNALKKRILKKCLKVDV